MLTVTRSLPLWPERFRHELATVLRQLDAGIAGQQVRSIDESYSPMPMMP